MVSTQFYSSAFLLPERSGSEKMEILYYLVSGPCDEDDASICQTYGVEVRLMCGTRLVAQDTVGDITASEREAKDLLELLYRNTVTPVTLRDVIEDRLGA